MKTKTDKAAMEDELLKMKQIDWTIGLIQRNIYDLVPSQQIGIYGYCQGPYPHAYEKIAESLISGAKGTETCSEHSDT